MSEKAFDINDGGAIYVTDNDTEYTKDDFFAIAKGNEDYAQYLFDTIREQHVETLIEDHLRAGEIFEYRDGYFMTGGKTISELALKELEAKGIYATESAGLVYITTSEYSFEISENEVKYQAAAYVQWIKENPDLDFEAGDYY